MPAQVATAWKSGDPFLVGRWRVEPTLNRLVQGEITVQLEHKAMDVLLCLAERPGEVVTKHELLDAVWQTEFVSDNTLQRRIAELRDGFGDDALNPHTIETIRKRGYRLIAEIASVDQPGDAAPQIPEEPSTAEDASNPYPGLAAFHEADADLFFGRESETASLWRTITSRRLLAVIGPSGIGKSSLLRAGVASRPPPGWRVVVFTPGENPTLSMARALAPDHAGDPAAVSKLVGITDPDIALAVVSRWRGRFEDAVLVVDQFEEIFTLNPPEVQANFVALLRRLVDAADIHIVLAMRDDFLYQCQRFPEIAPIFRDLTPLGPPGADALRRALTEPAARRLHRFESEVLVDRMVGEVEDQRSALPLLAFAVHRLWEMRDRENRILTEAAYESIGGVAGALARHAEATVDRIGNERIPIVRELFRNLVTAEGTRSVREVDELLSVFDGKGREGIKPSPTKNAEKQLVGAGFTPARNVATEVLADLIGARLLTSYESDEETDGPSRRVEISHESLLSAWPRLVRWQTQDADAAQLRDQLRQAARTWHERGRTDDLVWTGSAYREFVLWRERYPGGLSENEESFAIAMNSHAKRRKRLRRIAFATIFAILLIVLGIVGVSRQQAVAEATRAEAAKLHSSGRVQLESHPTSALAYAMASLGLADTRDARRLSIEALWRGPTETILQTGSPYSLDFSPDGRWLLTATQDDGGRMWPSDGGPPILLEKKRTVGEGQISPGGDLIAFNMSWTGDGSVGLWSFPAGRWIRSLETGGDSNQNFRFSADDTRLTTSTLSVLENRVEVMIRSWPLAGGEPDVLARLEVSKDTGGLFYGVDPTESMLAWVDGRRLKITPLGDHPAPSIALEHERTLSTAVFDDKGRKLATADGTGKVTIWSLEGEPPKVIRTLATPGFPNPYSIRFDPTGTKIGTAEGYLADLTAAPGSEPFTLRSLDGTAYGAAFHPESTWFASGHGSSVSFWPLEHTYPQVLRGHQTYIFDLHFTPDGGGLVSVSEAGNIRLWPLEPGSGQKPSVLYEPRGANDTVDARAMAPDSSFFAFGTFNGPVRILPLNGDPIRELTGFIDPVTAIAVGPRSRLIAAGTGMSIDREHRVIRVWDLETGRVRILDRGENERIGRIEFANDGTLWVKNGSRLRHWDLDGNEPQVVEEIDLESPEYPSSGLCDFDPEGRTLLLYQPDRLWLHDLDTRESRALPSHGGANGCRLDPSGEIVLSTTAAGAVRASSVTGGEAHLLLGHGWCLKTVTASHDGRWIASGGCDKTIRIWPTPDLTKQPLHTLPYEELLAKLRTFTNLRIVEDPDSAGGWKREIGPFPGWETAPSW